MESRASRDFRLLTRLLIGFVRHRPTRQSSLKGPVLSAQCMHITDNIEETSMIVENMTVSELRDLAIGHT